MHSHSVARLSTLLSLVVLAGCQPTSSTTDGGPADAGAHDASAHDASPPDAPSLPDAFDGVAECQSLATMMQTACATDAQAWCLWGGYRGLCTTGNAPLLLASLRCLDPATCTLFSNAGASAGRCLAYAEAGYSGPAALRLERAICMSCDPSANCGAHEAGDELLKFFAESDLANLESTSPNCTQCWGSAAQQTMCSTLPGLDAFAACL